MTKICVFFSGCCRCMQIDVCKTLYHFISLCWLNIHSYFCYEMFSSPRQSRMIFSFHILHNIHFVERFLRIKSCNLRKNKSQINMSGEKNKKDRHSRTIISSMEKQNYMLTRLSYHLLKLEHHASFKKTEQMNCKNSPQQ